MDRSHASYRTIGSKQVILTNNLSKGGRSEPVGKRTLRLSLK